MNEVTAVLDLNHWVGLIWTVIIWTAIIWYSLTKTRSQRNMSILSEGNKSRKMSKKKTSDAANKKPSLFKIITIADDDKEAERSAIKWTAWQIEARFMKWKWP